MGFPARGHSRREGHSIRTGRWPPVEPRGDRTGKWGLLPFPGREHRRGPRLNSWGVLSPLSSAPFILSFQSLRAEWEWAARRSPGALSSAGLESGASALVTVSGDPVGSGPLETRNRRIQEPAVPESKLSNPRPHRARPSIPPRTHCQGGPAPRPGGRSCGAIRLPPAPAG